MIKSCEINEWYPPFCYAFPLVCQVITWLHHMTCSNGSISFWHALSPGLVIVKCNRGLLQSTSGIIKCDRNLLQSASVITNCDRLLFQALQSVTGCYCNLRQVLQSMTVITKWYVTPAILLKINEYGFTATTMITKSKTDWILLLKQRGKL